MVFRWVSIAGPGQFCPAARSCFWLSPGLLLAQPLLAYRILQDPGAYADTLTLRFDLQNALSSTGLPTEDQLRVRDPAAKPYKEMPELVVGIIHQRVFEAFWNDGETFPSRVVVDDVLN
eukprot:COSAG06_NODE_217_length_20094_cov_61.998500_7_plen_119_part_00